MAFPTMPGIPADQVLANLRLRQWAQDRQALKTSHTTDYQRTGWKQRKSRAVDARIVRVLSFEQAFAKLETEHQTVLAATFRDNLTHNETVALLDCSPRKIFYLLPSARAKLADILNRLDLLLRSPA